MIDNRVVEVIRGVGRETNTPQEIVDAVVRGALPSVRLLPQFPNQGRAPRLGGCRIGGLPDLPEGTEWPRLSAALRTDPSGAQPKDEPLWFLAQINLAEVAFADIAGALPKAGMLYFFFHWHPADDPDVPDAGYVAFHKACGNRLQRTKAPGDMHHAGHFRGADLLPYLEWTVPSCDATNYHLGLWDNLTVPLAEVQGLEPPLGPTPVHRMLGYPEFLQADGLAEGEGLLLQISSDCPAGITEVGPYPETGMMWGDLGRIYFMISETELRSQRFGNTWACLENQ